MPTANITVENIYAPAEGGKMYRLVGDDQQTYFVWADKIDMYEEGGNYDLSYNAKSVAPGKTINIVDSTGGGGRTGNRRAAPAPAARAPRPHPIAAPQAAPKAYPPPPVGQHDEHIFVSMCLKEAVRAQLLDPFNGEEIVRLGKIARKAHKMIWAAPSQQQQAAGPNDDMNDGIPF